MRDFKKNTGKWGRTLLFFLILAVLLGGISRKITKTAEDQEKWVHYRNKSAFSLEKNRRIL